MSSSNDNSDSAHHSSPIPINNSRQPRNRSVSVSSASTTSGSPDFPQTPASSNPSRISIPSQSTSPILSYFFAQSPTSKTPANATFPFMRKFGPPAVFEADEELETEVPVASHARRATTAVANRFSQPPPALPDNHLERGAGLLRRLSLSSTAFTSKPPSTPVEPRFTAAPMSPPSPPPNSAVNSTQKNVPFARNPNTKPRRSATVSDGSGRPRRAPSPMGERILKGHFDGFN